MSLALPLVGSAGRTCKSLRLRAPRIPEPIRHGDTSSYCLICASWYFSDRIDRCTKCGAHIYLWLPNADLHLMRSRSTLAVL
jgi:hypothetical protein